MDFQLLFPQKIIFQNSASKALGKIIKDNVKKTLILSGGSSLKRSGNYDHILNSLKENDIEFVEYQGVSGEPTPELIDQVTDFALSKGVKSVVAVGGGSVIDTGKAVAGLVTNELGVENYLEGVGNDYKLKNNPLPFIALPTTAGSGAEATKNAVVTSRVKKYKKSFRDERLVAKIIIVDPLLSASLPLEPTANCGMDAICQLIESYVTKKKNPYCMALSSYYIPRAIDAILKLAKDLNDLDARKVMAEASLASGIALANSGLGAVHGFASGIGGMFDVPHGLICALLLPAVFEKNSKKDPVSYQGLARLINVDNSSDVASSVNRLYELNNALCIPQDFKGFGISGESAAEIVERSKGSSMNGNPALFSDDEWIDFIKQFL